MLTRRNFIAAAAAAAGAALLGNTSRLFAATYDLILKGARVIDPALKLDAVRDVAISDGRIAAVDREIAADATQTVDVRGKLVVPGLIDIHSHAGRDKEGPALSLADGVTCFVDAGSQGADGIGQIIANVKGGPQRGRVLVNISRAGILPDGDTSELARADPAAARDAIAKNRDIIVGVKARLTRGVAIDDVEVLKRTQEAASAFDLPVMIHMGQTTSPMPRLLELLKPGDIVTHFFAPPPNAIIDDAGRIFPEVLAARRRGIWFDVGNGVRDHIRWDVVEKVMQQGFWPDTFSTDWNVMSKTTGVIDFPNCMSKFFGFGMSVSDAIACATVNAARTFPAFSDRGTLNVGAPADVAVLELRDGTFEFLDNYENKITGRQRLFPAGTVLAGKWIARA